jgi:hypothetical protein
MKGLQARDKLVVDNETINRDDIGRQKRVTDLPHISIEVGTQANCIITSIVKNLVEGYSLDADAITDCEGHGVGVGVEDVVGDIHLDWNGAGGDDSQTAEEEEDLVVGEGGREGLVVQVVGEIHLISSEIHDLGVARQGRGHRADVGLPKKLYTRGDE